MRRFPGKRVHSVAHQLLDASLQLLLNIGGVVVGDRLVQSTVPKFVVVVAHSVILVRDAVHYNRGPVLFSVSESVHHVRFVRQRNTDIVRGIDIKWDYCDKKWDMLAVQQIGNLSDTVGIFSRIDVLNTNQGGVKFRMLLIEYTMQLLREKNVSVRRTHV